MTRKPRNRFAQPFLIGALSSTFLGACVSQDRPGSSIEECPKAIEEGSSCEGFDEGLTCETSEDTCEGFRCAPTGKWELVANSCNPPPPLVTECPEELPGAGTSCSGYQKNLRCEDPSKSCPPMPPYTIACGEDGTWEVVHGPVKCNPPPPPIAECPEETPALGTSCVDYEVGLSCDAPEYSCHWDQSRESKVRCNEERLWVLTDSTTCNPPPPITKCPEELPKNGSSCATYEPGLTCRGASSPECPIPEQSESFECTPEGTWKITPPTLSCNPPPPPMGGAGGESPL